MKSATLFFLLFSLALVAQEDIKHYNEGVKAQQSNNYPTAIQCYEKCLAINPNNKDAIENIGIAYYNHSLILIQQNNYEKAIECCKKSLEYKSKNPDAYHVIGNIQREQKQYQEALKSYTQAISFSQQPARFYAARAWIYHDLNDHKAQLADMKKAVEQEPENAHYQFHCGKFKQEVGPEEFKTAEKNYTKAIELNPDYVEAYTERAAYYMTFQQFEKALDDLRRAKDLGAEVSHLLDAAQFELEMQQED